MSSTTGTSLELTGPAAIGGLGFRRPRGDDADYETIAEMIGTASRADGVPWSPSGRMVRDEWEEGDADEFDAARDAIVATIAGRVIAVAGVYRVMRNGRAVYQLWGHVDPEWRRRGLGTTLLRANLRNADERSIKHGDERPGDRPVVRSYVGEHETGAAGILTTAGLVPIRWSFLMRRPTLDDIPTARLPDGLEFRPVKPEHHRAIIVADHEAFQDHWEPRDFTESSFRATFERAELTTDLWVVAWDGAEVAGSVQTWIWPDENERLGVRRGWLESISVRRPWRRRGVARAMTAEALRRLRDAGMDEAMLGVDAANPTGALELYLGLGFEVDRRGQQFSWPPDIEDRA
jgi:mycothiol synthase